MMKKLVIAMVAIGFVAAEADAGPIRNLASRLWNRLPHVFHRCR